MRIGGVVLAVAHTLATGTMKSSPGVSMHWFRKGLRLRDNPALLQSLELGQGAGEVFPVYILDADCYQLLHCNALRANFLVECLADLNKSLRERGSRLYVASGDPVEVLPELWTKFGITHMTHEGDETGEPYAKERDAKVRTLAKEKGVDVRVFNSETLFPLGSGYVSKVGNNVEKVPGTMSAFQALFGKMGQVPDDKPAPEADAFPSDQDHSKYDGEMLPPKSPMDLPWPRSVPKKEATPLWGPEDCKNLTPIVRGGESEALTVLRQTTKRPAFVASFEKPKTSCTSTSGASTTVLSPYMSMGCLSPRTMWHALTEASERAPASVPKSKPPVSLHGQLLWRDFNNLIAHATNQRNPGTWGLMEGNHYCRQIPWGDDDELLEAWKKGETGFPWIDACMAQLRTEGWIHHLGRHAVACFLTRGDLWQSWEKGQLHFEEELLDADYALNGFNWLWLSCSGFFYQYFRCYSPVVFQKKNDKNGDYIRKWLPQLRKLPEKYIYEPWKAPASVLKDAGITLGKDYPEPIVDHAKVSKQNMEKMSFAYDLHKEKQAELAKAAKKSSGTKRKGDTPKKSSGKKKKAT